jgi:hypothetical protein
LFKTKNEIGTKETIKKMNDLFSQLDPQKNFFTEHLDLGKRPRQYATKIIDKKTILERRELLSQVPEEYRALVETHVRIAFDRLANKK